MVTLRSVLLKMNLMTSISILLPVLSRPPMMSDLVAFRLRYATFWEEFLGRFVNNMELKAPSGPRIHMREFFGLFRGLFGPFCLFLGSFRGVSRPFGL
jgi:hypothetical protein